MLFVKCLAAVAVWSAFCLAVARWLDALRSAEDERRGVWKEWAAVHDGSDTVGGGGASPGKIHEIIPAGARVSDAHGARTREGGRG